jgi:hypothetical protein
MQPDMETDLDRAHMKVSRSYEGFTLDSECYMLCLSLWLAVNTGTIDDVQKAIDQGVCVNWPVSDDGKSVLYVAVMLNDAEKVRLLIDNDADLFYDDWSHELYEEYVNTHFHVFDILYKARQDWNDEIRREKQTKLDMSYWQDMF